MSWIKVRHGLLDDPSVLKMVRLLASESFGVDEFAVVGRLVKIWQWADCHLSRSERDICHGASVTDCHALEVTASWVDRYVGCEGFANAMAQAGWLIIHENGIEFPNFERHMSQTAKERALASNRQKTKRQSELKNIKNPSRSERDICHGKSVTREEKRREEKNKKEIPPHPPKGEPAEPTAEVEAVEVKASYDPSTADLPMPLDTPTFRQAWCEWWKYRRERRLPVYKPATIRELLNSFLAWGEASAVDSVKQSIRNGWAGLFEPKESKPFAFRREPAPLVSSSMDPKLAEEIFADKPRRDVLAMQADIPPLVGLGVRCG